MKIVFKIELDSSRNTQNPDDRFLKQRAATAAGLPMNEILSCRILKRSLDARKKPCVKILYSVEAELASGATPQRPVETLPQSVEPWHIPEVKSVSVHPVVIGAGPAGLFAALVLAEAGAKPLVLERGRDVVRRAEDISRFFTTRIVDPESNYLYGEGGAGTWSDGKLFTRVRDPRADFVMRSFVEGGAPQEIQYYAHPHLGSDRLPGIISAIRSKIISLGGCFRWESKVERIEVREHVKTVILSDGERIDAPAVIAGGGHSSRELIHALIAAGAKAKLKGFQIGCRIEHSQEFINLQQFGIAKPGPMLGAAEYLFSSRPGTPGAAGATTFCMCPGGEIIPAVCEPGHLSTNGMSNAARDGYFANAAIVTTIPETQFTSIESAFDFLDKLEQTAFHRGGDDFSAPAQTALDFLHGQSGRLPKASSYRLGLSPARLDLILPSPCTVSIKESLWHFEKMSHGYLRNGTLIGVETHVSSPVRFERNPETMESTVNGLYICGEGGGTAGGIVSAAVDGAACAEAWLRKFSV